VHGKIFASPDLDIQHHSESILDEAVSQLLQDIPSSVSKSNLIDFFSFQPHESSFFAQPSPSDNSAHSQEVNHHFQYLGPALDFMRREYVSMEEKRNKERVEVKRAVIPAAQHHSGPIREKTSQPTRLQVSQSSVKKSAVTLDDSEVSRCSIALMH
jgi:hypothetical protein